MDGVTLALLLVVVLATMAARGWLTAAAARRTYRSVVVRATVAVAAMAALHVAGAAYLAITHPQVGTWPLEALNTFLPVLLAAVIALWLPAAALTARPRLAGRRWGAWLQVVAPVRQVPMWTAGLVAASAVAYTAHLGGWLALKMLFG